MKEWIFTICMACVLAGGLELLLPHKEYEKSIKAVIALYILVSVLQPIQTNLSGWENLWMTQPVEMVDFSEYRAQLEQQALKEQLEQALLAQNIEGQIQISQGPPLTVSVIGPEPERARECLRQMLGEGDQIQIKAEEESNGT